MIHCPCPNRPDHVRHPPSLRIGQAMCSPRAVAGGQEWLPWEQAEVFDPQTIANTARWAIGQLLSPTLSPRQRHRERVCRHEG